VLLPEILALRAASVPGSKSHPLWPRARKVMPGVSFAIPGPADGVGSLASRRSGLPRRRLFDRLCRTALDVPGIITCPFRHRYYDPLRLPNVRRRVLRFQLVPSYLPPPLLLHTRDRPGGATGLSGGELWYRGRLPRVSPRIGPRFHGQETMRLSQVPVQSVSAWPGLRPRWSPPRLTITPRQLLRSGSLKPSAFAQTSRQLACASPVRDHVFQTTFGAQYKPYCLARPGSRPLFPPAAEIRYWGGG